MSSKNSNVDYLYSLMFPDYKSIQDVNLDILSKLGDLQQEKKAVDRLLQERDSAQYFKDDFLKENWQYIQKEFLERISFEIHKIDDRICLLDKCCKEVRKTSVGEAYYYILSKLEGELTVLKKRKDKLQRRMRAVKNCSNDPVVVRSLLKSDTNIAVKEARKERDRISEELARLQARNKLYEHLINEIEDFR